MRPTTTSQKFSPKFVACCSPYNNAPLLLVLIIVLTDDGTNILSLRRNKAWLLFLSYLWASVYYQGFKRIKLFSVGCVLTLYWSAWLTPVRCWDDGYLLLLLGSSINLFKRSCKGSTKCRRIYNQVRSQKSGVQIKVMMLWYIALIGITYTLRIFNMANLFRQSEPLYILSKGKCFMSIVYYIEENVFCYSTSLVSTDQFTTVCCYKHVLNLEQSLKKRPFTIN